MGDVLLHNLFKCELPFYPDSNKIGWFLAFFMTLLYAISTTYLFTLVSTPFGESERKQLTGAEQYIGR